MLQKKNANVERREGVKRLRVKAEELRNASWEARLELTAEEEEELREQLQVFFKATQGALQDIDLNNVKAFYYPLAGQNVLRQDIRKPSLPLSLTLANAPEADDGSFVVPKIIEE